MNSRHKPVDATIRHLIALAASASILAVAQPVHAQEATDDALRRGRGARPRRNAPGPDGQRRSRSTSCRRHSPLKAIEKLPGVNFQSADPFGAYEWSTRITIRGFNQNRLGFTLDGVPLGDMTYGNHNGLHISRAIPTELVGPRRCCRRAPARSATASASNLGGAVQFFSATRSRTSMRASQQTLRQRLHAPHVRAAAVGRARRGHAPVARGCRCQTREVEGRRRPEAARVQLQARAAGRRRRRSRPSTTTRIARRSTTRICRWTSSTAAAPDWDNYYPNWIAAVAAANACNACGPERRHRLRRRLLECLGPAQGRPGLRRARVAVRRARRRGRQRSTCTATKARASGARRTRRRPAARRCRSARRNTTSSAKAS